MLEKGALLRSWQASQHISPMNNKSLHIAVENTFVFYSIQTFGMCVYHIPNAIEYVKISEISQCISFETTLPQ